MTDNTQGKPTTTTETPLINRELMSGMTADLQQKLMNNVEDALPDMQLIALNQKVKQLNEANLFIKDLEAKLKERGEENGELLDQNIKLSNEAEKVKTQKNDLDMKEKLYQGNIQALKDERMEFGFEKRENALHIKLASDKADIYKDCFDQIVAVPVVRTTVQAQIKCKTESFAQEGGKTVKTSSTEILEPAEKTTTTEEK